MTRKRVSEGRGETREAGIRPYHHGDLRRALLDAALGILREEGAAALTLRAVARAAGVSQAAPYRHFADRAALVAGVAEESFGRLRESMLRAVERSSGGDGRRALRQIAFSYLDFAFEHPAEYRVMFGPDLTSRGENLPEGFAAARLSVFELLRQGIVRLQQAGRVRPVDPTQMALSAWALVHGLAMLTLDGQVANSGGVPPREVARTATDLIMHGMAARPSD